MGCGGGNKQASKANRKKKDEDGTDPVNISPRSKKNRRLSQQLMVRKEDFIREVQDFKERYEREGSIGIGAFAQVIRIKRVDSQDYRAAKVFKFVRADKNPGRLEAINMEIEITKQLDHQNIIKLYEVVKDPRCIYLILELCEGGIMIDKIIKEKTLSEQKAASIMQQLLQAVGYMHSQGICHLDIKPENILFLDKVSNIIRLVDMGSAKYFISEEGERLKLEKKTGTVFYSAPEMVWGEGGYDERCDIWSIGTILYLILGGVPPFTGKNDSEVEVKILNDSPNLEGDVWNAISKDAKDILTQMLQKNPSDRPSALELLKHSWFTNMETISDDPISADVLTQMANFEAKYKLQQAALEYMVVQLETSEEQLYMGKVFRELDKDGNGVLTPEELKEGYLVIYEGNEVIAHREVNKVLENADANKDGLISYTEFMMATLDKNKLMSDNKLEEAFNAFDIDKNGSIEVNEVMEILGANKNNPQAGEAFLHLISEFDDNKDGVVSL